MKKIIFLGDVSYIHLFIKPLYRHLNPKGYSFILLLNDVNDKVEYDNSICKVINIKSFSLQKIENILTHLQPEVVLISNYKSLLNLVLLNISHHLKIKTIFIQHGVFDERIEKIKSNNYFVTIKKYFWLIPLYFQLSKYKNYSKTSLLKELFMIYKKHKLKEYYCRIDGAVVFAEADAKFINRNLGILENKIHLSSYPIFNRVKDCVEFYKNYSSQTGNILLIHQPFIEEYSKYNYRDEVLFYKKINDLCLKNNMNLIIKFHPLARMDKYDTFLEYSGLQINSNRNDNIRLIQETEVVLAYNSTAIYYAILLKKPIILIPFIDINVDYLKFSKIGIRVANLETFKNVLTNKVLLYSKISNYDAFINKYIGRKNSYENLADVLTSLF